MLNDLTLFGAYALDAFWLPVACWTLLAAAALLLDRALPVHRPLARRDALVALLWALPLGLALRPFWAWRAETPLALPNAAVVALDVLHTSPSRGLAETLVVPTVVTAATWVGAATLAVALAAVAGLLWLALDAVRLRRWLRRAAPRFDARAAALADGYVPPGTPVLVTDLPSAVPLAYGFFAPVVVLPAALLDAPGDARLALAHETAHLEHGDVPTLVTQRLAAALCLWHPLVALVLRRLRLLRELAADAAVLAEHPAARRSYGELLLRFADTAAAPPLAPAMAVRTSELATRLTAMKTPLALVRPAPLGAALLVLGIAGLVVPAFAMGPARPSTQNQPDVLETNGMRLIARRSGANPAVPLAAFGRSPVAMVTVSMIVGPDGTVRSHRTDGALSPGLAEAVDAVVPSWTFAPLPDGASPRHRLVMGLVMAQRSTPAQVDVQLSEVVDPAKFAAFAQSLSLPTPPGQGAAPMPNLDDRTATAPMPRRDDGTPTAPMPGTSVQPSRPVPAPASSALTQRLGLRPAVRDTVPTLLEMPAPVYPGILQRAGIGGMVVVRLDVDATGAVTNAEVVRSDNEGFNDAALQAARAARFRPALRNGQPAPGQVVLPIRFVPEAATPRTGPFRASGPPGPDGSPPEFVEVTRQPELATRVDPVYPQELKDAGIEGRVVVRAWVTKDGAVRNVQVLRTDHEGFSQPAMDAVRRWTFTPAEQNGTPVDVWMTIPVRFRK